MAPDYVPPPNSISPKFIQRVLIAANTTGSLTASGFKISIIRHTKAHCFEKAMGSASMSGVKEEQLLQLLADTQSSAQLPRARAEALLLQYERDEVYPINLSAIASHTSVPLNVRQSALSILRLFVEKNWSGVNEDDEPVIHIPEASKQLLRVQMLELATNSDSDRKIRGLAR